MPVTFFDVRNVMPFERAIPYEKFRINVLRDEVAGLGERLARVAQDRSRLRTMRMEMLKYRSAFDWHDLTHRGALKHTADELDARARGDIAMASQNPSSDAGRHHKHGSSRE